MKIPYNSAYVQRGTFTSPPEVIWEEPHRQPSQQRMDSPVAYSTICAMPTAITQLLVRYIHTAQTDTRRQYILC